MIKFKDQSKKSKQVSTDSWLLKPLSGKHENKSKQRSTNKQSKTKK